MSLLINIDTALDAASVCLTKDNEVIELVINENQKDHAAWLHKAISEILLKNSFRPDQVSAVAVSIGPGSYTGLRVGLAAAKGLCYALHIPLVTVSTLEMMAFAVKEEATTLICPLIDARRMEVFTAVYDKSLHEKVSARAMIIDERSFESLLSADKILFCGNGRKKLQLLITNTHASFSDTLSNASHLAALSIRCFHKKQFADLAYSEPLYIKEFYSPIRKT